MVNRAFIKYWLNMGGISASALLILELIFRVLLWSPWPHFVVIEGLGRVVSSGSLVIASEEGWGYTHYTDNGEVFTPFSSGDNIVVLGDSFTEALQVSDNAKYASVAEKLLWADHKKVNIRNLGQGGLSLPDYIYRSSYIHEHFLPIAVVVQVNIDDFSESFSPRGSLFYFYKNEYGTLDLKRDIDPVGDDAFRSAWIRQQFALINFSFTRWHDIQNIITASKNEIVQPTQQIFVKDSLIEEEFDQQVSLALDALHDAYQDIPIILIIVPEGPTMQNGQLVLDAPNSHYFRILEIAQKLGWFYLVTPLEAFAQMGQEYELPRGFANTTPGFGHLNIKGHEILGRLLANTLKEVLP